MGHMGHPVREPAQQALSLPAANPPEPARREIPRTRFLLPSLPLGLPSWRKKGCRRRAGAAFPAFCPPESGAVVSSVQSQVSPPRSHPLGVVLPPSPRMLWGKVCQGSARQGSAQGYTWGPCRAASRARCFADGCLVFLASSFP